MYPTVIDGTDYRASYTEGSCMPPPTEPWITLFNALPSSLVTAAKAPIQNVIADYKQVLLLKVSPDLYEGDLAYDLDSTSIPLQLTGGAFKKLLAIFMLRGRTGFG